jgi:hypothetical protein
MAFSPNFISWCLVIFLGAAQAWAYLYTIASEDTISYLDIADAYLQGRWHTAVNGNWSPLYSWLLGLIMLVFKPHPYWEFPLVKVTNFLIYLLTFACFNFFLRELIFYHRKQVQSSPSNYLIIPKWVWLSLGNSLFLLSSLKLIGVNCDTPDMCTAALIYLASGILLGIHTRSDNWLSFFILGIVLGFSYLSKAPMFWLSFVFIAVGMLSVSNRQRALSRGLVALLAFAIVSAPFITTLSAVKGRLTYSDTGKLSYSWYINPGRSVINDVHWQGAPPGHGVPKHPTRKIFDNPPVFEFTTPIGGTYPPWYDPSHWYEGLKFKFSLSRQIKVLASNIIFYFKHFLGSLVLIYLILVCGSGSFLPSLKGLTKNWRSIVPAISGLAIYMLVTDFESNSYNMQPSTRFIAPFIVLLFAGVFSSLRIYNSQKTKRLIVGVTIAILVTVGSQLAVQSAKNLVAVARQSDHVQWRIAEGLQQLNIQPDEKVAILGDEYLHLFWARLAKVKIVAQVPDGKSFWKKDAGTRARVLKTIEEKTGVRAILYKPESSIGDLTAWRKVGNTSYYAFLFRGK